MATAGPIGAVAPAISSLGVKRPLQGNPVRIPSNQPGFRGKVVENPNSAVKIPKITQSNLPNRSTNTTIP
jgi:hypothetical protein